MSRGFIENVDPCLGIFQWKVVVPMSIDFLQKTDPKGRNVPVCLNMWVPPGLAVAPKALARGIIVKKTEKEVLFAIFELVTKWVNILICLFCYIYLYLPMMRINVDGAKPATRQSDKANTNAICRSEILLKHLDNNLVPISIPVKKEIRRGL